MINFYLYDMTRMRRQCFWYLLLNARKSCHVFIENYQRRLAISPRQVTKQLFEGFG